ncbi:uncharacterized protein LOC125709837 [Brienomyrus brachyistius]|uniref:uncharacterized protein LOC125709837 n=1 Tax=Brienomyrus brachyistius TaxID=42636 RepID=UPI0020B41C94|nr:uncharacterized protein LOC125709837 [Brienomyrus brachyistius]
MVHTCVVVGCRNRRTPGTTLSFYRFPRDPERKQRWIAAVNREGWQPNEGSRLCSTHFISGKQVKNPRSPDYVPSVFRTSSVTGTPDQTGAFDFSDKQQAQVEAANALLFLQGQTLEMGSQPGQYLEHDGAESVASASSGSTINVPMRSRDIVTPAESPPSSDGDEMSSVNDDIDYEEEVERLRRENRALRELAERASLTEASLRNDPAKVRFYTGLPSYFVLETVLWLLSPRMRADKTVKLSRFQQLLITLMRLRLDLRNQDLAYRFGVQVGIVAQTVRSVVDAMSSTLVPTAVFWPSREELRRNLPTAIQSACPDCVAIVDCFTVALEGSSETGVIGGALKYLIGVAPQGVVTFVSGGSPGHVSDRELVENCGFLAKLLPGDVVLAGHELDADEAVAARGAQIRITNSRGDVGGEGEERAVLRRHVERVIAMVKRRYAMLNGLVENTFDMNTFDRIVRVACALNNLCISATPLE